MVMSDLVTVSKDVFFNLLEADPRDIMPRHDKPDFTTWETPSREVWGKTTPGWKNPGDPATYAVTRSAVKGRS